MSNRRNSRPTMGLWGTLILLCVGLSAASAHQDPCHRLHRRSSDHSTYVCGDKGRCNRCPDHEYCLGRKPRVASSPTSAPPVLSPSTTTTPSVVTVCFTPGGRCTDANVHVLSDAKRSTLVQAYSFTSTSIAKALLDAHKRGIQVQVILDRSRRTENTPPPTFWRTRVYRPRSTRNASWRIATRHHR